MRAGHGRKGLDGAFAALSRAAVSIGLGCAASHPRRYIISPYES